MADTRIISIFIFAISFIITFPILVAYSVPYQYEAVTFHNPNIPEEFAALDLTQLAWTDNDTVGPTNFAPPNYPENGNPVQFMLPPIAPKIEVWGYWGLDWGYGYAADELYFDHVWMEWWWRRWDQIIDSNGNGFGYSKTEILNNWDSNINVTSFKAQCSHGTRYYIYISYDNDTYSSMADALDNFDIMVFIGVGWDDTLAAPNAWSIVGSLMTFQLADIPTPLNYILGIPFYGCIGILAVIIILWFIPFLGD